MGGAFERIDGYETAPNTPTATVNRWNDRTAVGLVELTRGAGYCLARVGKEGKEDFRACLLRAPPSREDECTATGHGDTLRGRAFRLELLDDDLGFFAVEVPKANKAAKPSCFSRPLLRLRN